jgi:hypothetical protein
MVGAVIRLTGWMIQGMISGKGKTFPSSLKGQDWPLGLPSLLFNESEGSFSGGTRGQEGREVCGHNMTTHLCPIQRLRMLTAILLLSLYTFTVCTQTTLLALNGDEELSSCSNSFNPGKEP